MHETATVHSRVRFYQRKAVSAALPALWLRAVILPLILMSGCDNGASGTSSALVSGAMSGAMSGSVYEALALPPPWTAPAEVDCDTAAFEKRSDVAGKPGGFWTGTLVDCLSGQRREGLGLIAQDGRFRIVSISADVSDILSGDLEMDGDTFASDGKYFFSGGADCADCWSTSLFVAGFVRDRQHLEGRWVADWGGSGYFVFEYLGIGYEDQIGDIVWSTSLTGEWDGFGDDYGLGDIGWTVDTAGRLDGSDSSGCTYTGKAVLADSRFNLIEVEVTLSGCESRGTYTGFAMKSSGPFNDSLWVAMDDGANRALRLFFFSR